MFWLGALGTVLLASVTRSLTGFGFALVLVPLLSAFWDLRAVVATSAVLGVVSSLALLVEARGQVEWRRVLLMLLGTAAGLPLGVHLLKSLDPSLIKLAIGVLVILFSVLMWLGRTWKFEREGVPLVVTGFVGGLLQGSAGMGGPPVVLFLLGQGTPKAAFRNTLVAYFVPTTVYSVAMLTLAGLVTADVVRTNLVLLPALAVGLWLGRWLLQRVQQGAFRAVALGVTIFSGCTSIYAGLVKFL